MGQNGKVEPVAAAEDPVARPFTITVGIDRGRQAMLVVPLDISDTELLFVLGRAAVDGRMAIVGRRAQDEHAGLVVPQRPVLVRPS